MSEAQTAHVEAEDTAAEETQKPARKPRGPGVGAKAKDLIRAGCTNEEVLAAVQDAFPEAKTSLASINWYRNKLRADGEEVPTSRELKKQAKADAAETEATEAPVAADDEF